MSIVTGTVEITKMLAVPPACAFAAWSSQAAQEVWGDPGPSWDMSFDRFNFSVGTSDVCRFGPKGGPVSVNENLYLEIVPNARIVYATTLRQGDLLTFAGTVAVTFEPVEAQTQMRLVEHGIYIDDHDSVRGHVDGWEGMLGAMEAYLGRT